MAEHGQAALYGKPQQAKIVSRIHSHGVQKRFRIDVSWMHNGQDSGSRQRTIRVRALPKSVYNGKPVRQLGADDLG